jgi:hypothetical protein
MKSGTGSNTPDLFLCREYGYPFAKEVNIANTTDWDNDVWNYAKNTGTIQDLQKGCGDDSPYKYLVWRNK